MGRAREVAVIGASASGLFTALELARKGIATTVFERAGYIDPAPRTLITTARLRDYIGHLAEPAVVNEITRFDLFADGKVATVELREPDLIVERSTLIRGLAKEAADTGVEIATSRRFLGLEATSQGVGIRVAVDSESEERPVSVVVGADGACSQVARSARWPTQPTIPLVQAIVRIPKDMDPHSSRVWFRPEDTPYFYWLVPHSESHGALGIIGDRPDAIRTRLEAFAADNGMPPLEFQGARIPLYTRWRPIHRRVAGGDVYLVGDAAGQVKVSTVGGLVTGFRGAIAVVQSILTGRPARRARSLRVELEAHRLIRKTLHDFTQDDYVGLFELLNDPAVASLGRTDRDQAAKALFKVFIAQPRLLTYSLRALLGRGSFPSS